MNKIPSKIDYTKLRDARGNRSMKSVAEVVGITRQHLWNIEAGKKAPSADVLAKLCWVYGINSSDIITELSGNSKAA